MRAMDYVSAPKSTKSVTVDWLYVPLAIFGRAILVLGEDEGDCTCR